MYLPLVGYLVVGLYQKTKYDLKNNKNKKPTIMKLKALLFGAAIFGASFFVTSTTDNDHAKDPIKKQAVDRSTIKIPVNG